MDLEIEIISNSNIIHVVKLQADSIQGIKEVSELKKKGKNIDVKNSVSTNESLKRNLTLDQNIQQEMPSLRKSISESVKLKSKRSLTNSKGSSQNISLPMIKK